jgi:hypothetical protein
VREGVRRTSGVLTPPPADAVLVGATVLGGTGVRVLVI